MGKEEELACATVREACVQYYVNRNEEYIMSNCAAFAIPIFGLIKPEWKQQFEVVNDHQHINKLAENVFLVSITMRLKDTSDRDEENKEMIIRGTFTCQYEEDGIKFTSVHLSRGDEMKIQVIHHSNEEYYKGVLKSLFDVIFEYDSLNNTFSYDPVKYRELFQFDTFFVSMDQWFWHMATESVHKDDTEFLDIFRSNDIGKRIRNNDCVVEQEIRIRNKAKGYIWVKMVVIFIPNKNRSNVEKIFVMFKNINSKKILEMDYMYKSRIDFLTGLYNREYCEQMIAEYLNSVKVAKGMYVIIDIDEFKKVNDTFGHITGDELLKKTSEAFRRVVSDKDVVGRFGGDEFVIFIKDYVDEKTAKSRLAAILENVQFVYHENKKQYVIRCSAGAVIVNKIGVDVDELYRIADNNLYEAKRAGKNTFRITSM